MQNSSDVTDDLIEQIKHYRLGQSIISKRYYSNTYDWYRGKIISVNEDGTYAIESLDGFKTFVVTSDDIHRFNTKTIHLPVDPDFSFMLDDISRSMIETGYNAIVELEGWKFLRELNTELFMFSNDPFAHRIIKTIFEMYVDEHNESSIGWTIRQLERISHIGVDIFKIEWLERQGKAERDKLERGRLKK